MNSDLERRMGDLEQKLQRIEREWAEDRASDRRNSRRATWIRIGALVAISVAYVLYIIQVTAPLQ